MTLPQEDKRRAAAHVLKWNGRAPAFYNPNDKPDSELPIIYGFNNGSAGGLWMGVLLAENGEYMGNHACTDEIYMPHDLGCLRGSKPDRHAYFRAKFREGYRMEFVKGDDVLNHKGLMKACRLNKERAGQ